MTLEFAGAATPLGPNDVAADAQAWGVEPGAVMAVCDTESSGGGFLPDGRPKILFESHQFHALTGGKFDQSHPGISTPTWVHNYGAAGAHQYDRLAEAIALDRQAALEAASWGMFQILGTNHTACGFADVESYVAAMVTNEAAHLAAFGAFCRHGNLLRFLSTHNWSAFALHYNGPGQVDVYAADLARAYARHATGAAARPAQRLPGRPSALVKAAVAEPADDGDVAAEALNAAELRSAA